MGPFYTWWAGQSRSTIQDIYTTDAMMTEVQLGNRTKRLERDMQLEKKKVKRARAKCEQEPMTKFKLIVPNDDLLAVAPPEWQEDQKQALFELRSCCFAVPVGFECTWRLKLDGPSCGLVDALSREIATQ